MCLSSWTNPRRDDREQFLYLFVFMSMFVFMFMFMLLSCSCSCLSSCSFSCSCSRSYSCSGSCPGSCSCSYSCSSSCSCSTSLLCVSSYPLFPPSLPLSPSSVTPHLYLVFYFRSSIFPLCLFPCVSFHWSVPFVFPLLSPSVFFF